MPLFLFLLPVPNSAPYTTCHQLKDPLCPPHPFLPETHNRQNPTSLFLAHQSQPKPASSTHADLQESIPLLHSNFSPLFHPTSLSLNQPYDLCLSRTSKPVSTYSHTPTTTSYRSTSTSSFLRILLPPTSSSLLHLHTLIYPRVSSFQNTALYDLLFP